MSDAPPLLLAVYGLLRPGLSGWQRFDLNRRTIHLGRAGSPVGSSIAAAIQAWSRGRALSWPTCWLLPIAA